MIDLRDMPLGLRALDALAKEAEVEVLAAGTVQAGEYLILFGGQVEPVQRSYQRALRTAAAGVVDGVMLPWAEERIVPAIRDGAVRWPAPGDTLGVVQTTRPPTMLKAVDAALKGALVELVQLRIAEGLGGKSIATIWGETHDVEAGIEEAERAIGAGAGLSSVVIRNVDDDVAARVNQGTHFFGAWRG